MVNITDMKAPTEIPTTSQEIWYEIWEKQSRLHEKYREIEITNRLGEGLVFGINYHIDNPLWQYYIKDMCWRVTEEYTEAREAYLLGHNEHYVEELIDALHFLVEIFVIIREPLGSHLLDDEDFVQWDTVMYLGLAANCLKNKPWKQTSVPTDPKKFLRYLYKALKALKSELHFTGLSDEDIFKVYCQKHDVNQFRIRSNY